MDAGYTADRRYTPDFTIEKQLELRRLGRNPKKNPQTLKNGEPSSITDKLESLVKRQFKYRPHNSLIHFARDKTRNPTLTSNLNLETPTFVPGQIEDQLKQIHKRSLWRLGLRKQTKECDFEYCSRAC
ncbi:hypothetical protein TNCV_3110771 [Trichonephila clavipes]|nr:hypothetical protein TNCV_3110771 [Trichonephila clavipes]